MKSMRFIAALAVSSILTQPALAKLAAYPVPTGPETAHFFQGVPTLHLETDTGGVEITALPFDHGHVVFGVAVYNKTVQPANFGIENVTAEIQGAPIAVLSEQELEKRAKSRAAWSQVGMIMLAGAAAAAVANAHTTDHYYGHVRTPHGTYAWSSSYRDNSLGVVGATAAVAAGTAGVIGVQNRLDYTLQSLNNETVQTTTVEADASYGGKIVIEKPKGEQKTPYDMKVAISWNGHIYPFVYRVTDEGKNLPAPFPAPVAAPLALSDGKPNGAPPAVLTTPPPSSYEAGKAAGAAAAAASAPSTS
jgi:hypothetical protein